MDWHAYKITNRNVDLEAMERRYADIMRGQDIEMVTYNPKEVDRRADEIFHLFNTAWAPNWGHVPLTRRQFDEMFEMVKPCLRPGMAYVLLDDDRAGRLLHQPAGPQSPHPEVKRASDALGQTPPALLGQVPAGPQSPGPGGGDQPALSAAATCTWP